MANETVGVSILAAHIQDLDTDGTLAGNSDNKLATQKAVKAYVDAAVAGAEPLAALDTDAALAANSDAKVATQKAVKAYVDAKHTAIADGRVLMALGGQESSDSDLSFDIINDRLSTGKLRMTQSAPPSTAASTGVAGDVQWDSGFVYVCVATNTWVRVALATW